MRLALRIAFAQALASAVVRVIIVFLLALVFFRGIARGKETLRIAVSGGSAELQPLADLVMAEISRVPGLELVERAELDRLGQEKELQRMAGGGAITEIKLLKADALILLRNANTAASTAAAAPSQSAKKSTDGSGGIHARLVATESGVVLREIVLPSASPSPATSTTSATPPKSEAAASNSAASSSPAPAPAQSAADLLNVQAQAVRDEFKPLWPKVLALREGKAIALSLVGLRLDLDLPSNRDLERSFNVLLASRLSAAPDVIVLERWRLNEAAFEKSLATASPASPSPAPSPLWSGACVVDGAMRLQDNNLMLDVNLRPAGKPAISFSTAGDRAQMQDLINKVAVEINRRVTQSQSQLAQPWTPEAEAARYSRLADWCLNNGLYDQGIDAAETAVALGDTSSFTHMLRIKGYGLAAYMHNIYSAPSTITILPDTVPGRVVAARRMCQLTIEYISHYKIPTPEGWKGDLRRPDRIAPATLYTSLKVLQAAWRHNVHKTNPEAVAALRRECRSLIQLMENSKLIDGYYISLLGEMAAVWHETPEETLAYYRKILSPDYCNTFMTSYVGKQIRTNSCASSYNARYPLLDKPDNAPGSSQGGLTEPIEMAWIIDWRPDATEEGTAVMWRAFLNELAASADTLNQADALKLAFTSTRNRAARMQLHQNAIAFLESHATELNGRSGDLIFAGMRPMLMMMLTYDKELDQSTVPRLQRLYVNYFNAKQRIVLPSDFVGSALDLLYKPALELEPSRELLAAATSYADWYRDQTQFPKPRDERLGPALSQLQTYIMSRHPSLVPPSTEKRLVIRNFFKGAEAMCKARGIEMRKGAQFNCVPRSLTIAEDKAWMSVSSGGSYFIAIDLATHEVTEAIPYPGREHPAYMQWAQSLSWDVAINTDWIVIGTKPSVLVYHRPTKVWKILELPPSRYRPRWVNGELYLLFDIEWGDTRNSNHEYEKQFVQGSGVFRVKLPEGTVETLANSRRTPAQNSLDGKPMGIPKEIWLSDKGLTLSLDIPTTAWCQTFYYDTDKKDWLTYRKENKTSGFKLVDNGCLTISFGQKQMTLIGPKGSRILAESEPAKDAQWIMPKPMTTYVNGRTGDTSPMMRGEDLCIYRSESDGPTGEAAAALYYFTPGQREALRIPIDYDITLLNSMDIYGELLKPPALTLFSHPSVRFQDVKATSYGIVVASSSPYAGFWIIPWSEVDAYRKEHAPKP